MLAISITASSTGLPPSRCTSSASSATLPASCTRQARSRSARPAKPSPAHHSAAARARSTVDRTAAASAHREAADQLAGGRVGGVEGLRPTVHSGHRVAPVVAVGGRLRPAGDRRAAGPGRGSGRRRARRPRSPARWCCRAGTVGMTRGVDHPQPGHPADAQLRVDHGADRAAADRVVERLGAGRGPPPGRPRRTGRPDRAGRAGPRTGPAAPGTRCPAPPARRPPWRPGRPARCSSRRPPPAASAGRPSAA